MQRHDETFACMGTTCRVLIEDARRDPAPAGAWARRHLERAAAVLTRFDPDSELSRLNANPDATVAVSGLLHAAIGAALWASAATDGLVDPTLHDAINDAGYARSMGIVRDLSSISTQIPDGAPPPRPARPDPRRLWRDVTLGAGTVTRPPGLTLDTGGTTKGLLADSVAHALAGYASFVVDCGGDMRLGGREPRAVHVAHPYSGEHAATLQVTNGAVATSGIARRTWTNSDGTRAHHLLDPATGEPAWTGIAAATALAPTALEAEARAKAALLSGSHNAEAHLHHGGVFITADGSVLHVTPIEERIAA